MIDPSNDNDTDHATTRSFALSADGFESTRSSTVSATTPSPLSDSAHVHRQSSITPIPRIPRQSSTQSEQLTIDKLDFRHLGLMGREEELQTLRQVIEHAGGDDDNNNKTKQLVWIHGESGTGKSALIRQVMMEGKKKRRKKRAGGMDGPLFAAGKFDDRNSVENGNYVPYAGIAMACGAICATIVSMTTSADPQVQQRFHDIRKSMEDTVGASGLEILVTVIPALTEVIDTSTAATSLSMSDDIPREKRQQDQEGRSADDSSAESSANRLNHAFKSWINIVIEFFSPLIIVLDDLQWADDSSLSLLEALMTDRNGPTLVVVGIYRSNEVGDEHPLTNTEQVLATFSTTTNSSLEITEIPIGNLQLSAVHAIVRELLTLDDDPTRTLGLAQLCLKKTHGNVLFLLQYMRRLHQSELIRFNLGALRWIWDEETIIVKTEATDNVVSLLQSKMESLGKDHRKILPLAAALGSTFSERVLGIIWRRFQEKGSIDGDSDEAPTATTALTEAMASFELEGYIESVGNGTYRWAHDRIREAAASLVSEELRPSFHRELGEIMLRSLDEADKDSLLFDIVGLLNQTVPVDEAKILSQAHLNLNAAKRAIGSSAFAPAAKYAARGIELVRVYDDPQQESIFGESENYDLLLELFSLAAQAEGFLGNVSRMESYCNAVLAQKKKPLRDKFRVYDVLVDSLANRGQLNDAVNIILDILAQSGCRLPVRGSPVIMPRILWNVLKIKRKLNNSMFDNLEPMKDALRVELVRFLNRLITYFYLLEDSRMPLAVFQMLSWTMKYGYCEYSTIAIGFTGVIFISAMNDLQSANICRELTLILMNKMELRVSRSRTLLIVHGFLQHWAKPLRHSFAPLLKGYEAGLKSGDTESASWCIYHFCLLRFFAGDELGVLEKDLRAYCMQTADLQRLTPSYLIAYVWQAVLNIQGRGRNDCLVLDGDAVDANAYALMMKEEKYKFVLSAYYLSLAILYCYMGAHEKLANLTCEIGFDYIAKVFPGTLCPVIDVFVKGVSCYAAARQSKNRKFGRMGKKCL
ncbi:MAG: hypothetical protein SGILL_003829, partial [Bacillariaceae sp.]